MFRFLLVAALLLSVAPAWAGAKFMDVVLPPNPTPVQVRAYLKALDDALAADFEEKKEIGNMVFERTYVPNSAVTHLMDDKLSVVPTDYFEDMCKAAKDAHSKLFEQFVADSLSSEQRQPPKPEQKPVALKFLKPLPKLILLLDRMNWIEVEDPAIVSAWKVFRDGYGLDGRLDPQSNRAAVIFAKRGMVDALVSFATSTSALVKAKPTPAGDEKLRQEIFFIHMLVPATPPNETAADFVLQNKRKLVFDAATRRFVIKS